MDSQMGDSEQEGLREDVLLSLDSLEAPSVGALPSPSALRDLENARRNHKIQMGFHTLQKQTSYLRLCGAALIVGLSSVCYIIAWAPSNTTLWIIPISALTVLVAFSSALGAFGARKWLKENPDAIKMDAMRSGEKRTDPRTDNQVLIDKYHELTTRQARTSYRNSQYAMAVGFALLVLGGAIALRSPSGAGQVVIGTLTALGTSLSAYLGATFLRAYERALLQMNYYFGQPLVTSYILQAERLSGALSSDRRDEAIVSIIQEALRGASNASQALNPVVEGQASTGRSRRGRSAGGASSGAPAGS